MLLWPSAKSTVSNKGTTKEKLSAKSGEIYTTERRNRIHRVATS